MISVVYNPFLQRDKKNGNLITCYYPFLTLKNRPHPVLYRYTIAYFAPIKFITFSIWYFILQKKLMALPAGILLGLAPLVLKWWRWVEASSIWRLTNAYTTKYINEDSHPSQCLSSMLQKHGEEESRTNLKINNNKIVHIVNQ